MTVNLSNGAAITIAAGASSGSVSFAAPTDDVYVDAGAVSVTIDSATGGNFEALAINPAAATTLITDTLDTTTVSADRNAQRCRRRQHRLHRKPDGTGAKCGHRDALQRFEHQDRGRCLDGQRQCSRAR